MDDQQDRIDPREDEEGPEGSKLAPAGNSDARLFIPKDPEPEEHPEEDEVAEARGGEAQGADEGDE